MSVAYGAQLANAAVIPDGVELDFQGDKCGQSYRIKKNCIGNWECFFFDWREGGWFDMRDYGRTRHEAIENCNKHAIEHRLLKFLPTKPKYKPNWGGWGMGGAGAGGSMSSVASQAASVASGAVSALFGL